jgi:hypothetical protein
VLGTDIDQSAPAGDELDDELEKLTDQAQLEQASDEAPQQVEVHAMYSPPWRLAVLSPFLA